MSTTTGEPDDAPAEPPRTLEHRLNRIEARADIAALVSRYARAADARDIETLVGLYADDVDCGSFGRGSGALRTQFTTMLRSFYRSVHFVCGQAVDDLTDDSATGTTYCLAFQQMQSGWISVAVRYSDRFAKQGGSWRFVRRVPRVWYVAPAHDGQADPDELWPGIPFRQSLPDTLPTWTAFWAEAGPSAGLWAEVYGVTQKLPQDPAPARKPQ